MDQANHIHKNSKYSNKIPIYIDFATLNESNLDILFSENIKNLNDNLFIRSNMNTLILSNIDLIPLKFQKQFLLVYLVCLVINKINSYKFKINL